MKTFKVLKVPFLFESGENKTKIRILERAKEQFLKFGFTKVTTDEIASSLGISKATLYKHFSSKEELLGQIVEEILRETEAGTERIIHDKKEDFVGKLISLMTYVGIQITTMGGLLTLDIQRNAPDIWKEIEDFRREKILIKFRRLVSEGIKEGVFRNDFDQDLLVTMYTTLVHHMMIPSSLIQFPHSSSEVFEMMIRIILEGILADKARRKYFLKSQLCQKQKKREAKP